jgi:hypothetical protein
MKTYTSNEQDYENLKQIKSFMPNHNLSSLIRAANASFLKKIKLSLYRQKVDEQNKEYGTEGKPQEFEEDKAEEDLNETQNKKVSIDGRIIHNQNTNIQGRNSKEIGNKNRKLNLEDPISENPET